jgi:hypothetical protein
MITAPHSVPASVTGAPTAALIPRSRSASASSPLMPSSES